MDRYWLLTSTFYGNWLPGDRRGFVSSVRDHRPEEAPSETRHEHDLPGTPYDADFGGLHQAAKEQLKQAPILVNEEQAEMLVRQFQETAQFRGWRLLAVAVMPNHVHWVVGVPGDPEPEKILGDFKAYGSRVLTRRYGKPQAHTWWTHRGSKRKLGDEAAVRAAIEYVRNQQGALVVLVDSTF